MFARAARTARATRSTRFYSSESFNNKYNFNLNPPPIHAYWNARNATVVLAFVPVFLGAAYTAKWAGEQLPGFDGLSEFAKSDKSPLSKIPFAEPQSFKPAQADQ